MSKSASRAVADKKRAAPRSAWKPGQSGNPAGRAALPPEVRDSLVADTMPRINRLKKLSAKAEKAGDLKTAAHIELALLKKSVPDATELVLSIPDGIEVRQKVLDPRKLSADELRQLAELTAKATKEGA